MKENKLSNSNKSRIKPSTVLFFGLLIAFVAVAIAMTVIIGLRYTHYVSLINTYNDAFKASASVVGQGFVIANPDGTGNLRYWIEKTAFDSINWTADQKDTHIFDQVVYTVNNKTYVLTDLFAKGIGGLVDVVDNSDNEIWVYLSYQVFGPVDGLINFTNVHGHTENLSFLAANTHNYLANTLYMWLSVAFWLAAAISAIPLVFKLARKLAIKKHNKQKAEKYENYYELETESNHDEIESSMHSAEINLSKV